MKKNKTKKQDDFVYRNGKEIMKEIRQDWLDSLGDTELTRIIFKHFDTDNPSPDAVKKAGREYNIYLQRESQKVFKEII